MGPFVYPLDQYNETSSSSRISGKHKDYLRKQHVIRIKSKDINIVQPNKLDVTDNPLITADMNTKKVVTIVELKSDDRRLTNVDVSHKQSDDDDNSDYSDEKMPTESERKFIIPLALKNPTAEPRKSHLFQDSSTNIDDLKRHILMLQNLTKNDQNFQSKFVVFPHLQRNQSSTTTTTTTTTTQRTLASIDRAGSARSAAAASLSLNIPKPYAAKEMLRGVDGTPMPIVRPTIVPQVFLQNDQTPMNDASFEDTERRTTTAVPARRRKNGGARRNRKGGGGGGKKNRKSIQCRDGYVKHPNCTIHEPYTYAASTDSVGGRKLSRNVRSHQRGMRSRDLLFPSTSGAAGNGTASHHGHHHHSHHSGAYKESVDLNPDLCYNVSGLSYGQQKLCVLHTHIMPAVSRGARAAIQVSFFFVW